VVVDGGDQNASLLAVMGQADSGGYRKDRSASPHTLSTLHPTR